MKTTIEKPITEALNIDDKGLAELYDLFTSSEKADHLGPFHFTVEHSGTLYTKVANRADLSTISNTDTSRVMSIDVRADGAVVRIDPDGGKHFMRYELTGDRDWLSLKEREIREWIERRKTTYSWGHRNVERMLTMIGLGLVALISGILISKYHVSAKLFSTELLCLMALIVPFYLMSKAVHNFFFPRVVFSFNGGQAFFSEGAKRRRNFGFALALLLVAIVTWLAAPSLLPQPF